jgi:dienelactone hydrolase
MAHGMSALKDMDMNLFAEYFTTNLPVACLGYDHRGFGDSDTKEGQPRFEIIPAQQNSDFSDAITYAQSLPDIDPDRIGIWGTSLSGGHALWVGAVDRRVKLVLCQVPMVDGWTTLCQMVRPDFVAALNKTFQDGK